MANPNTNPTLTQTRTLIQTRHNPNTNPDINTTPTQPSQVALDKDGMTPLTLFTGHGYSDIHNLAVMFCQDGDKDSDCVTTVQ